MFRTQILYTGVNGQRSVTVSKVTHVNCSKKQCRYFTVTGVDKREPRVTFLPPSRNTKDDAMHDAMIYLLTPVLS